jgi:UDP-glucose 4-epimerase
MGGWACLVTGGAGFIGSHVATRLAQEGHRVRVVDNLSTGNAGNLAHLDGKVEFLREDLTSPDTCRRVAQGMELVFHLAALPSVPRSMEDPWGSYQHNVTATMQLLLAARDAGVRRVVYSSSSSVYGDTPVLPKAEPVEPLPRSPYAAAKLAGEQFVLAFARAGLLEGVALRYFNVFGPRQSPDSAYAAVIPAFLAAARDGRPAQVHGDGGQTRDFTYVDNVVDANLLAAARPTESVNGVVCNVGAGQRTSLLELLQAIREVTGQDVPAAHGGPRPGDVRDSLASLDRAREVLGYRPSVSLREGLARTWHWFQGR